MKVAAVAHARAFLAFGLALFLLPVTPAHAQSSAPTVLNVASLGGQLDQVFKAAFKPFEDKYNVTVRTPTCSGASSPACGSAISCCWC
jgi:spermidine/putrescine-binding protein